MGGEAREGPTVVTALRSEVLEMGPLDRSCEGCWCRWPDKLNQLDTAVERDFLGSRSHQIGILQGGKQRVKGPLTELVYSGQQRVMGDGEQCLEQKVEPMTWERGQRGQQSMASSKPKKAPVGKRWL
ncbi:hypothetical protein CB1_000632008 [Camelus ferus]|nr:hypothetical protein CB1_000632008 [Camelus ferus]